MRFRVGNRDLSRLRDIFWSSCPFDVVFAGGQVHGFAGVAIDLGVEVEVGSKPAGGRRINAFLCVAKQERGDRGTAVEVENVESHRDGWGGVEEDVEIAPKAEILGSLADVEPQLRLATAGVATVNRDQAVFDLKAGERLVQWTVVEARQVHPALGDIGGKNGRVGLGAIGRGFIDRSSIGAVDGQRGGHPGLVLNLHEEDAPAVLVQLRRRGPLNRLDPALGIDRDSHEAKRIKRFLDRLDGLLRVVEMGGVVKPLEDGLGQRLSQKIQRLAQTLRLRGEGLEIDFGDNRKHIGTRGGLSNNESNRKRNQDAS